MHTSCVSYGRAGGCQARSVGRDKALWRTVYMPWRRVVHCPCMHGLVPSSAERVPCSLVFSSPLTPRCPPTLLPRAPSTQPPPARLLQQQWHHHMMWSTCRIRSTIVAILEARPLAHKPPCLLSRHKLRRQRWRVGSSVGWIQIMTSS